MTSLDISLMRRVILGIATNYPGGTLWKHVRSDQTFADPAVPWDFESQRTHTNVTSDLTGQDFIAIKNGDVNGSWTAPAFAQSFGAASPPSERNGAASPAFESLAVHVVPPLGGGPSVRREARANRESSGLSTSDRLPPSRRSGALARREGGNAELHTTIAPASTRGTVTFALDRLCVELGQLVKVPVRVQRLSGLTSVQFTRVENIKTKLGLNNATELLRHAVE